MALPGLTPHEVGRQLDPCAHGRATVRVELLEGSFGQIAGLAVDTAKGGAEGNATVAVLVPVTTAKRTPSGRQSMSDDVAALVAASRSPCIDPKCPR